MEQFDRFMHLQQFARTTQEARRLDYPDYKSIRAVQNHRLRVQKYRLLPHLLYLEDQFSLLRGAIEQDDKAAEETALKNILCCSTQLSSEDREWVWHLLPDRDIPGNLNFIVAHYSLPKPE